MKLTKTNKRLSSSCLVVLANSPPGSLHRALVPLLNEPMTAITAPPTPKTLRTMPAQRQNSEGQSDGSSVKAFHTVGAANAAASKASHG